jgi:tetratricopeptide (TPR) repeat protein
MGSDGKDRFLPLAPKPPAGTAPGEAGGLARAVDAFRSERLLAPAIAAAAARTAARARQAREQAALGLRLAGRGQYDRAIDRLEHAAELDPAASQILQDLGRTCFAAGRFDKAADAMRRAVALDPDNVDAQILLGRVLDFMGRVEDADQAFAAAVRLDSNLHEVHARRAQIARIIGPEGAAEASYRAAASSIAALHGPHRARLYEAMAELVAGRPAEAEALLRALVADDPTMGEPHLALGEILSEDGRSDEAAACYKHSLTLDSRLVEAWRAFAVNHKFQAADAALIARMGAELDRTDLSPFQRQSVHYALGKAFDDTGDYAAAIKNFDAANHIKGATLSLDRAKLAAQTDRVIASTPPGFLDRHGDYGVDDRTPVLIVGMPRSGTTLVEQILSSHPDVAAGGELGFWRQHSHEGLGVWGDEPETGAVRRAADDYLAVLRSISSTSARVTDKAPFNFAHLGAILRVFPRAAIIHCRRHPIDTCLSIYSNDFSTPFDFMTNRGDLVFFYREYLRLMSHWRVSLPPGAFIDVDYEALVADPEPHTRRLVETCGLEWNDACLAPQENRRRIATASVWQARQPIYRTSSDRWRRYEPWLGELRDLFSDAVDIAL